MDSPKPNIQAWGSGDAARNERRAIVKSTLEVVEDGQYHTVEGAEHDIRPQSSAMLSGTRYCPPDSLLAHWPQPPTGEYKSKKATEISIVEISTLEGANQPHTLHSKKRDRGLVC